MSLFRSSWWLFPITLCPLAMMLWVGLGSYQLVEIELSPFAVQIWVRFGILYSVLWIGHLVYTLIGIQKQKGPSAWYAIVTLFSYTLSGYLYYRWHGNLFPVNIPHWMANSNTFLYTFIFQVPTLIHSLALVVIRITRSPTIRKGRISLLSSGIIFVIWISLLLLIIPADMSHVIFGKILKLMIIGGAFGFLFFLFHGIYQYAVGNEKKFQRLNRLWRVLFALAFPLTGLMVDSEMIFELAFSGFSHPGFYVLALVNGIAICLPETRNRNYRMGLFVIRTFTYMYALYFFLAFLPVLPVTIIGIVAYGMGFLMAAPLVFMVFQTKILLEDIIFLKPFFVNKGKGFSLIPISKKDNDNPLGEQRSP